MSNRTFGLYGQKFDMLRAFTKTNTDINLFWMTFINHF